MVTAIVLAKNEEKNISACLKNLKWCHEVIIVDDNSTDKTVQIAKSLGVKVFEHNLDNDFSRQRNYGLDKAKGEWVLFVDADERVSEPLKNEILNLFMFKNYSKEFDGYYIKRRDVIWGKKLRHGETGNMRILRLARKDRGVWEGTVHEGWNIKGTVGVLKNPIYHYPHQTLTEFLTEINFYTSIRAKEMFKKKTKVYWWSIIVYPKVKFFSNYFIKRGFMDGLRGLVFAILMSFHSFLVRGKLWLLWQRKS